MSIYHNIQNVETESIFFSVFYMSMALADLCEKFW